MREQASQRAQASQSPQRPAPNRARHRATRRAAATAAALAAGILTMTALTPPPASAAPHPAPIQRSLNALVNDDGMPAALASVQDRNGHTRTYTAGVADLATGAGTRRRPSQDRQQHQDLRRGRRPPARRRAEGRPGRLGRHLPARPRPRGGDRRAPHHRPPAPPTDQRTPQLQQLPRRTTSATTPPANCSPRPPAPGRLHPRDELEVQQHQLRARRPDRPEGHRPPPGRGDRPARRRPVGLRHTYFPAPGDASIREPHPTATTGNRRTRRRATSRRSTPPGAGRQAS